MNRYLPGETRKLSHYIAPMLAKETELPFNNKDWIFEIKWDGYRAIAEVNGDDVNLYSRNGNTFNDSYPTIVDALKKMKIEAILDGEIVALDKNGVPSFQLLQHYNYNHPLIYYAFDLLSVNQKKLTSLPLIERKNQLKKLLKKSDSVKYSDHVIENGIEFFNAAVKQNLEGIMAKDSTSKYSSGVRTSNWLKIKHHKSQEAIIVGFTAPGGSRQYFGSLVLAIYKGKKLKHIGQTGTGFNTQDLKEIFSLMKPLITKKSSFENDIEINIPFTPVKPVLVCEVKYTEVTDEGKLRHPVFLHLRDDKKPKEITGIESTLEKKGLPKGSRKKLKVN